MANKYIIHGATYNGDGTSSAEATSDGGVGAWNTLNYFDAGGTPAYGTISTGDVIYIRSKDAANSNITRSVTANHNLGQSGLTLTWVIDNGTVWSGVDGTITYERSNNYITSILANNTVINKTKNALILKDTRTSYSGTYNILAVYGKLVGAFIDCSAKISGNNAARIQQYVGGLISSLYILYGHIGNQGSVITFSGNGFYKVVDPEIEILASTATAEIILFDYVSGSGLLEVDGGWAKGDGIDQNIVLTRGHNASAVSIFIYKFKYPRIVKTLLDSQTFSTSYKVLIKALDCDDELGSSYANNAGIYTSRTDNNPPVLNVTLPTDAGTGWSWRCYPKAASDLIPLSVECPKFFNDTSAAKTITLNFLLADTFSGINTDNCWLDLFYVDATTGYDVLVSSKDIAAGSLSSSTATWSAVTWGMISFDKYQISLATPTAIKKGSIIKAIFNFSAASVTSNDILFVDPDFAIGAA